jgi:hypothetical protein
LYGNTNQGYIRHTSTHLSDNLEQGGFASTQKNLAVDLHTVSPGKPMEPFNLKATENIEEEEEQHVLISSKKISYNSRYFAATYWAQALSYFFWYSQTTLPVDQPLSYFTSQRRHLLFQVFRI